MAPRPSSESLLTLRAAGNTRAAVLVPVLPANGFGQVI